MQRQKEIKNCEWHKEDEPINYDEQGPPGCQSCGRLYWTKKCPICDKAFINWSAKGFDDICAAPYITESGDVYCDFCGPRYEDEEEPWEEEWDNDEDGFESY